MTRLSERYRPKCLAEVLGQSATRMLQRFVASPFRTCFMFKGAPGIGKTSAALALANELGCDDEFSGLHVITCSEFNIGAARELFRSLHLRPMAGNGWRVVVFEEMERLHPQVQVYLKVALERDVPEHCIIIATSNDTSELQDALLERFTAIEFDCYDSLPAAGLARLRDLWAELSDGAAEPRDIARWGWSKDSNGKPIRFSMRAAFDKLQVELLNPPPVAVPVATPVLKPVSPSVPTLATRSA